MKAWIVSSLVAALVLATAPVRADDVTTFEVEAAFEDVTFDLNNAIVNRGLKIDYRGMIGEMLKRTAEDVGSEKPLYAHAEFFHFCSAVLSRRAMETDLGNIAYCPYVVFAYEPAAKPGK